jgi:heat shock protein HslJ
MQTKSIRYQWHILILALALVSSGCAAVINANTDTAVAAPPKIGGPWFVEYIGSRPVIDRSPANFLFDDNGQVSGNASCNQFTGSTRRACFEALGEQEQRFLATVPLVAKWGIKQGLLELYDADGEMLFRAARHTSTTIIGNASYRQRIAMPAGAVFTAVLLDVSKIHRGPAGRLKNGCCGHDHSQHDNREPGQRPDRFRDQLRSRHD